ncbi:MAG TPA: TIGR01906 family membrane protein [Chloroflexota bacterium]|nr:TIGR01906 family membrane protein [Chloroflexota bacterium]
METTAPALPLVAVVRVVATICIALAIPVFLVTNGVRAVALDEGLYMSQFGRYGVARVTGLSQSELRKVASAFVSYFQGPPGPMRVTVETARGPEPLFGEREIQHMEDVQRLIQRMFLAWGVSLVALALGAIAIIVAEPRTGAAALFRALAIGGGTSVVLVGLLFAAAVVDFDRLFLQFHFMSFANDLWILDPSRDRLIQLFPEGYFFDAAIRIGVQTVGFGAAILIAALGLLLSLKPR